MHKFQGAAVIDGSVVAGAIHPSLDLSPGSLIVRFGDTRKDLCVTPFIAEMITKWSEDRMREGIAYNLAGTAVGFLNWGPTGHPGDGEFECKSITAAEIGVLYNNGEITVSIGGCTEKGQSAYKGMIDPSKSEELPGWEFRVSFRVPRGQVGEFLSLQGSFRTAFEGRLDACARTDA